MPRAQLPTLLKKNDQRLFIIHLADSRLKIRGPLAWMRHAPRDCLTGQQETKRPFRHRFDYSGELASAAEPADASPDNIRGVSAYTPKLELSHPGRERTYRLCVNL
jgi:hypothetical protein